MLYRDFQKYFTKNEIHLPSNQQIPMATHPHYYVLMKLGNMMRVEILNLTFNIKDGLKIVSKTKPNNCWSTVDQGLHCASEVAQSIYNP